MQSIRFSHYVFGIDGSSAVLKSRRVSGASDLALANKPIAKQARALTVSEVKQFHSENNVVDRTITSHMLLMLCGGCRHSDTLAVQSIEHYHIADRGYSQLSARLVFPVLIPTYGVGNELWAQHWRESRMETGLAMYRHRGSFHAGTGLQVRSWMPGWSRAVKVTTLTWCSKERFPATCWDGIVQAFRMQTPCMPETLLTHLWKLWKSYLWHVSWSIVT